MIEVFKFGGAAVKDAAGIRNLVEVIKLNKDKSLLIVVSAMGKMTNKLEELTSAYLKRKDTVHDVFEEIKSYHENILNELFEDKNNPVFNDVANAFVEIDWIIEEDPHEDEDYIYDQIVSIGELVSTKIVSAFLSYSGITNRWLDARSFIHTDNTYREGQVDWQKTTSSILTLADTLRDVIGVTQGFIGGTSENFTTTLGREGSDYTAAIFASCLKAKAVTIWKDVPGVLNADPKLFTNTVKYDTLPYAEALEMTYYGATVIHPKTIKPLQNLGIPLIVKPFLAPLESGTIVSGDAHVDVNTPAIIIKNSQVLLSLYTKDVSFITEDHLSDIFGIFAGKHVKINMMQISAISFSVCIDYDETKFTRLKESFKEEYSFKYNTDLELLTIRHFNQQLISELTENKTILMEQISRNTAQLVLRKNA